jgi:hypothetical protein
MRHALAFAALALTLSTVTSSDVRADLAPRPGYVEQCTIEKLEKDGTLTCESCSTYFREADKCERQFANTAFKKQCRAGGASTWTELWCKPKGKDDGASPSPLEPAPAPAEPAPAPAEPAPKNEAAPANEPVVKGADVAPKRDSKCGAGGLELVLPLLASLFLLVRRRK